MENRYLVLDTQDYSFRNKFDEMLKATLQKAITKNMDYALGWAMRDFASGLIEDRAKEQLFKEVRLGLAESALSDANIADLTQSLNSTKELLKQFAFQFDCLSNIIKKCNISGDGDSLMAMQSLLCSISKKLEDYK